MIVTSYKENFQKALQQNEFFLEYQPQVSHKNKTSYWFFEALISLEHPKLRYRIPQPQFIPLAEENGFIIELEIGFYVLLA